MEGKILSNKKCEKTFGAVVLDFKNKSDKIARVDKICSEKLNRSTGIETSK